MNRTVRWGVVAAVRVAVAVGIVGAVAPAFAQAPAGTSFGATEVIVGHAAFADEGVIHHSVFGASAPFRLSPRVSVGPSVSYMVGPGSDRDVVLAGELRFNLLGSDGKRPPRATPFLTAGGGAFFHSDRFGTSGEGYVGGGGGVKVQMTDRLYIAPEVQFGWELHIRTVARIGYTWSPRAK